MDYVKALKEIIFNPVALLGLVLLIILVLCVALIADRFKWWERAKRLLSNDKDRYQRIEDDAERTRKRLSEEDSKLLRELKRTVDGYDEILDMYSVRIKEVDNKVDFHLQEYGKFMEKENEENIMIAVMKNEQANQEKEIAETKGDVQNIYKLMSEIKTLIIQGQK